MDPIVILLFSFQAGWRRRRAGPEAVGAEEEDHHHAHWEPLCREELVHKLVRREENWNFYVFLISLFMWEVRRLAARYHIGERKEIRYDNSFE